MSDKFGHDGTTLDIGPAGGHIPRRHAYPRKLDQREKGGRGGHETERQRYITGEMGRRTERRGEGAERGGEERQVGETERNEEISSEAKTSGVRETQRGEGQSEKKRVKAQGQRGEKGTEMRGREGGEKEAKHIERETQEEKRGMTKTQR